MSAKLKPQRAKPISLYPLKFEEIVRDVLTITPPPKGEKYSHPLRQSRKSTETPVPKSNEIAPANTREEDGVGDAASQAGKAHESVAKTKRKTRSKVR